jgi:hypothetical protein
MRVSEYYRLDRGQGELDFVDVDVRGDTRLYVDPRALRLLTTDWGQQCVSLIQHFFRAVLAAIREGRDDDAKRLLSGLREPNETHLGLSSDRARGSALGPELAIDVWEALAETDAATSGMLQDLEETALLVPGIDKDRISDIATNIIREPLIVYTQLAAEHYGIPLEDRVDSGPIWDASAGQWFSRFERLPLTPDGKLLLVPKAIVRKKLDYNGPEYFNHYLLTYLQDVELQAGSELVRLLKSGERRPPSKKSLKEKYGTSKPSIARLTREYPEALENYRAAKRDTFKPPLTHEDFFDEGVGDLPDLDSLLADVRALPAGKSAADRYHKAVEKLLSALLYPALTNPEIEYPIHHGRKRIDIAYANVAERGFFGWVANHFPSARIFVECKNYEGDPKNPELDQLTGRFSPRRGKVGLLICRRIRDKPTMAARCKDAANDDRGFVLALDDDDLDTLVRQLRESRRLTLLRERFDGLLA